MNREMVGLEDIRKLQQQDVATQFEGKRRALVIDGLEGVAEKRQAAEKKKKKKKKKKGGGGGGGKQDGNFTEGKR